MKKKTLTIIGLMMLMSVFGLGCPYKLQVQKPEPGKALPENVSSEAMPPPVLGKKGSPDQPAVQSGSSEASTNIAPGSPAPEFALNDLEDKKVTLSELRGKVVVLNFVSMNCPHCLQEMPSVAKLAEAMSGKPFALYLVTSDDKPKVQAALGEMKLQIPALLDPEGKVADAYGVEYTPTTYIIGSDGVVKDMVIGARNWADQSVVDYLNKLIGGEGK